MSWKHPIILTLLLAILTVLFLQSRDLDRTNRMDILEQIQQFKLHDAELSRDVVMAKSGLSSNYDPLMLDRRRLQLDIETIDALSQSASSGAGAVMASHLTQLRTSLQEKLAQVEHFKSNNALIRNSLMYLTYSVAILEADAELQKLRLDESSHLQTLLLRFVETLDTRSGKEIDAELVRLREVAKGGVVPILVAHGRIIVDVLPELESSLRSIIHSPSSANARDLEKALLDYSGQVESRAQTFRYCAYFFSLIIFAYLLHLFIRLRAVAIELFESNAGLQLEMVERARAEIELRISEDHFRSISESANEAIVTVDAAGRIVSWNSGARKIFGFTSEEIYGKPLSRLVPPDLRDSDQMHLTDWAKKGISRDSGSTVETMGVDTRGEVFPIEISRSQWTTESGVFETGIIRNISQKRHLEETSRRQELQLIQANKMSTLGTLVSGVAHEINNPNQYILLNARILERGWRDAIKFLDEVESRSEGVSIGGLSYAEARQTMPSLALAIQDGARKIEAIVNGLKDYSRTRSEASREKFDLNDAVRRTVRLLGHLIADKTEHFAVQYSSDPLYTLGNCAQVEQVIGNLLTNALEALPGKHRAVLLSTGLDVKQQTVWLSVKDEGAGIGPEFLSRICDPFFTTKLEQGGTGLGLAISSTLVQANKGRLTFSSKVGSGTCATLYLRCYKAA
jgi:PAS domain S-box-containing protein